MTKEEKEAAYDKMMMERLHMTEEEYAKAKKESMERMERMRRKRRH